MPCPYCFHNFLLYLALPPFRPCPLEAALLMASVSLPSPAPLVPSHEQAALAIAVIRSKPAGTTVRGQYSRLLVRPGTVLILSDHLLRLRAQVRQLDQGHYLDSVDYWQQECMRLQAECNQLRSVNIKLERSNQLLASRSGAAPASARLSPTGPKCKGATVSKARLSKRPKPAQQRTVQQAVAETQDTIESDSDFLDALGEGKFNLSCWALLC